MSVARNRSGKIHGSSRGPRVSVRSLIDDLQGARDALIAFDGFEPESSSRSQNMASVLERPTAGLTQEPSQGWLQWLASRMISLGRRFNVGFGHQFHN